MIDRRWRLEDHPLAIFSPKGHIDRQLHTTLTKSPLYYESMGT